MTNQASKWAGLGALLIAVLTGCPAQLQEACDKTADCAEGLECLEPKFVTKTENCVAASLLGPGTTCNLLCETDDDCAELGDDVGCFHFGCPGSDSICLHKNNRGEPVEANLNQTDAGT